MENFDWTSFTKRIAVKAPLADVYNAWTTAAQLEKWFLEKVEFRSPDNTAYDRTKNVIAGATYNWYWYLYPEPMPGKIIDANGNDFIQFTFEGDCLVDVRLEETESYTVVTLRHHNIALDDHSKQFVRLGCTNGWTFYLANLKSVCEGGLDLRNKDVKLSPMSNN